MSVEIVKQVLKLKKERNAVILAHNYQLAEVQDVSDFVADSLALAYKAKEADADVIVLCGVHFMAETAKVANPGKIVLIPDPKAGCSLADLCKAEDLRKRKEKNPNLYVVAYVNCSAEVKALSDVVCTSGNSVQIVKKIPADREILFVPDKHLGQWTMEQTGRKMQLWDGSCHVHVAFTKKSVMEIKLEHPDALLVAHPECAKEVRDLADAVCSTGKMGPYCKNSPAKKFIIATEHGMLYPLQREMPDKTFVPAPTGKKSFCANSKSPCANCEYMKSITLEKVLHSLETLTHQIEIPEDVINKARIPIERMLEWSK